MIALEPDPWKNGVLSKEHHADLVLKKDRIASDAGIPAPFLWMPAEATLPTEEERTWTKRFKWHRSEGYSGLAYLGNGFDPTLEVRVCGIAGILRRNFLRARVMSMETVFGIMKAGETPAARCLLLPTFGELSKTDNRRSFMADLIIERWKEDNTQTVVCAPSLEVIGTIYGAFVMNHIASHYLKIAGAK
jgi:hypothetical protein